MVLLSANDTQRNKATPRYDYRHVIGNLVENHKPSRHYIYQRCHSLYHDVSPLAQTLGELDNQLDEKAACREYVKILYEAARLEPDAEKRVSEYLEECLSGQTLQLLKGQGDYLKNPFLICHL